MNYDEAIHPWQSKDYGSRHCHSSRKSLPTILTLPVNENNNDLKINES